MNRKQMMQGVLSLVATLTLTGCFSARPQDIEAFRMPHGVLVTTNNYLLQPPDEIELHCKKIPEVDMQRQRIRPDGKISFESLGEFTVAGKTPGQVAKMVEARAAEMYTLPEGEPVSVRVVAFESAVYYVLGEVSRPGPKAYTGRDSLLSALAEANLEVTAWKDKIQVIRPSPDKNTRRIFAADYRAIVEHGNTEKNVLLEEGDIVYVPPTILAAISQVIAEFARPIGQALAPAVQITRITYTGGY